MATPRKTEILDRTITKVSKGNTKSFQVRRDVRVAHTGAARTPAATEERREDQTGTRHPNPKNFLKQQPIH
jgi:hypothetical protein